jgi:excisionase family DNA binding protein
VLPPLSRKLGHLLYLARGEWPDHHRHSLSDRHGGPDDLFEEQEPVNVGVGCDHPQGGFGPLEHVAQRNPKCRPLTGRKCRHLAGRKTDFLQGLSSNPAATVEHMATGETTPHGLLTVNEVAQRLGVSRASVYRLCHEQELPYVRLRSGPKRSPIRFREDELEAWLDQPATGYIQAIKQVV